MTVCQKEIKMAKAMFDHLKTEKKEQIIQALFTVFSKKDLLTVSVKDIVEEAGIPRGSFYTYFEDLQDAYNHVLQIVLTRVHKQTDTGNPFEATRDFIQTIDQNPDRDFIRHYYVINEAVLEARQGYKEKVSSQEDLPKWLGSLAVHHLLRQFFLNPVDKEAILAQLSAVEKWQKGKH